MFVKLREHVVKKSTTSLLLNFKVKKSKRIEKERNSFKLRKKTF